MKKVAIYGQPYAISSKKEIKALVKSLNKHNIAIYFEKQFYDLIEEANLLNETYETYSSFHDLSNEFDVLFTIGGDGTILRAVTYIRNLDIPIVGINTGRLGFLAIIQKNEIKEAIEQLIKKEFTIQERSLLAISTTPKNDSLSELNFALNEVTIARRNTTSMIAVNTFLDNEQLTKYWADGLIISTPTGSTGYSLSCNGPVISPTSNSLVITPIAPHNLNVRSIVIPDETIIDLEVSSRENHFLISLDSRINSVSVDTKIRIQKADFTIKTILPKNKTFLKTLREKLMWGEDTRNNKKQ